MRRRGVSTCQRAFHDPATCWRRSACASRFCPSTCLFLSASSRASRASPRRFTTRNHVYIYTWPLLSAASRSSGDVKPVTCRDARTWRTHCRSTGTYDRSIYVLCAYNGRRCLTRSRRTERSSVPSNPWLRFVLFRPGPICRTANPSTRPSTILLYAPRCKYYEKRATFVHDARRPRRPIPTRATRSRGRNRDQSGGARRAQPLSLALVQPSVGSNFTRYRLRSKVNLSALYHGTFQLIPREYL